jgi:hypothetical protein|tara:strand:- start:1897 stop:2124 length:228 start_codon:yes stop_codon:yes gene_type:complete
MLPSQFIRKVYFCLYLIFKVKINNAMNIVMAFHRINGLSTVNMPYANQKRIPKLKVQSIPSERSLADLVFNVLMT